MRNPVREMIWCSHCGKNCDTVHDYTSNTTSCIDCGKILFEGAYLESHRKGNIATKELIHKNRINEVSHDTRFHKGREMIWCSHCARKGGTSHEKTTGTIHCVDCGRVLFEDTYNQKDTFLRDVARRNDNRKLDLFTRRLKPVQTAAGAGQLFTKKKDKRKLAVDAKSPMSVSTSQLPMKKKLSSKVNYDMQDSLFGDQQIPTKFHYVNGKEHEKEESITVFKEDYEQESCSYSDNYNYDYDGGDEYDVYVS
uniref:uncharacterized protein LOC122598310 n=1 Tax=Erigeron canadensis TaxID=72917 RepID=UPI001CB8CE9B|nr:uncharacterized protein LOC122598310 [Erigeron canadensis]